MFEVGVLDVGVDLIFGMVVIYVVFGFLQQVCVCMIVGEFYLFGKMFCFCDCVQFSGVLSDVELKKICEGLVVIFVQMGGKVGQVMYMDVCLFLLQGCCRQLFGLVFDGYYYECFVDDLVGLLDSCIYGGGYWIIG